MKSSMLKLHYTTYNSIARKFMRFYVKLGEKMRVPVIDFKSINLHLSIHDVQKSNFEDRVRRNLQ